jgi:hypothetical protein
MAEVTPVKLYHVVNECGSTADEAKYLIPLCRFLGITYSYTNETLIAVDRAMIPRLNTHEIIAHMNKLYERKDYERAGYFARHLLSMHIPTHETYEDLICRARAAYGEQKHPAAKQPSPAEIAIVSDYIKKNDYRYDRLHEYAILLGVSCDDIDITNKARAADRIVARLEFATARWRI